MPMEKAPWVYPRNHGGLWGGCSSDDKTQTGANGQEHRGFQFYFLPRTVAKYLPCAYRGKAAMKRNKRVLTLPRPQESMPCGWCLTRESKLNKDCGCSPSAHSAFPGQGLRAAIFNHLVDNVFWAFRGAGSSQIPHLPWG